MILPFVPAYYKLAAAGVVVIFLAAGAWKLRHGGLVAGRAEIRAEWNAERLAQTEKLATFNENQRLIERGWSTQLQKAQNERITKEQGLQSVVTASRGELNSLRDTLRSLKASASSESLSTCIARANTARDVFEQSVERYTGVTKRADGHAADAVMLQDAWPK